MDDDPLAFFITWTVYGTFLQGDVRGWRQRRKGVRPPRPNLARWRRERLKHPIQLLGKEQQASVEFEIERLSAYRGWHVWAANARSNHVHVVVSAPGYTGEKVRDQLKANCTRVLRERWSVFEDRPVWTTGGDWQCVNTEEDLEAVVYYASDGQDRVALDERKRRSLALNPAAENMVDCIAGPGPDANALRLSCLMRSITVHTSISRRALAPGPAAVRTVLSM